MKCQNCGIHTATTSVKTNINGQISEYMLCPICTAGMGVESFNPFSMFSHDSFLGSLMGGGLKPEPQPEKYCEQCGSNLKSITDSGKMGCAGCYLAFKSELIPTLESIHGKSHGLLRHTGKSPEGAVSDTVPIEPESPPDKLDELKSQLTKAIETENFELAVNIRDRIKSLESQRGDSDE